MAMKVKHIDINSLEAKRFTERGQAPKNVKVDNNSSIVNISHVDDETAGIKFRYILNYQGMGIITFEGTVLLECNYNKDIGDWSTTRQLPPETAGLVHNAILRKCIITSLFATREVELPPPIPLPTVNFKKKDGKVAGNGTTTQFDMYQ